jgi:cytochrome bd ubiquinol oxidase subunit I
VGDPPEFAQGPPGNRRSPWSHGDDARLPSHSVTTVDAARLQFALLAGIHFMFVLVTLGLGPVVAVFQTRWAVTGREVFERATRFWGQLYLVNYALGIAAGIVLELQFGLHFPGLLEVASDVFGAPLAVETMGAFFLESTFLGLWVFGWHLLPRAVHTLLFWLVVLTGYLSAFAVMVANGFLRNPVGYELVDPSTGSGQRAVARITDAGALVTNPAALFSAAHTLGACLVAGGFVLVGVAAWHLRRMPDDEVWRLSYRSGVVTGSIGIWLAIGFGFAQFSYFQDSPPNEANPFVGAATGLMISAGFLILLGSGVLLLLLIGRAVFRLPRLFRNGLFVLLTALTPVPFVVALLGWEAREIGRQPWVVVGLLRTEDAVVDASRGAVLTSLVVLVGIMAALAVTDWYVLSRLARRGHGRLVLGAPPADVLRGADDVETVLTFGDDRGSPPVPVGADATATPGGDR